MNTKKVNAESYAFSESLQTESAEFHAAKIKEPESKTLAKYNNVHIYEKRYGLNSDISSRRKQQSFPPFT